MDVLSGSDTHQDKTVAYVTDTADERLVRDVEIGEGRKLRLVNFDRLLEP
jgi:hypothetical protein